MAEVTGYRRMQIWLHWIVAALILVQFLTHEFAEEAFEVLRDGGEYNMNDAAPHAIGGLLVLLLVIVRILLRIRYGAPKPPEEEPAILQLAAKASHGALYLLILLMPVSGLVASAGQNISAADAHGVMTGIFLIIVAIHAVAALYHHFILKTDVMRRMSLRG